MAEQHLLQRLQVVRDHYSLTPWIEPRADESPLLRSWQRSEAAGLRPEDNVAFEIVSRSTLAEIDDRYASLIQVTRPEATRLSRALRNTDCSVLLVNERGFIVDRMIDETTASRPLQAVSRKGVNLDERCIGNTAPSIALTEGIPYLVGRDAHYAANNRGFFCVAAPIDDPSGRRLGALSIAAFETVPGFDVLSLVVHAATEVENQLFTASADRLILHFHARPELIGTPMEGIVAIDGANRVVGINRSAQRLLCVTRAALFGTDFGELIDFDLARPSSTNDVSRLSEMHSRTGLQLFARLSTGADPGGASPWEPSGLERPPGAVQAPLEADPLTTWHTAELKLIQRALAESGGNVTAAARQLGISRSSIYRRLAQERAGGA